MLLQHSMRKKPRKSKLPKYGWYKRSYLSPVGILIQQQSGLKVPGRDVTYCLVG
jgi:hypothetical protein